MTHLTHLIFLFLAAAFSPICPITPLEKLLRSFNTAWLHKMALEIYTQEASIEPTFRFAFLTLLRFNFSTHSTHYIICPMHSMHAFLHPPTGSITPSVHARIISLWRKFQQSRYVCIYAHTHLLVSERTQSKYRGEYAKAWFPYNFDRLLDFVSFSGMLGVFSKLNV